MPLFLALTAASAALYALTLFPGAGPTLDSLEFQTAVTVLGVVHPPGSPLYLLLGKLFTLVLPAGDIVLRLNLFSAFSASLALGILFLLVQRLTGSRLAAALAALLLAFSPQYWYQGIIAEARSLNTALLFAALAAEAVFALTYDVPDWPEFLSPAFLIFAVFMGIGVAAVIEWTVERVGKSRRRNLARWGLVVGAAGLLVFQGLSGRRQIQAVRSPFLRDWSASFLKVIEPEAWVLMLPVESPAFLEAWALRYHAWAVPTALSVTLVAPPGFRPPGPAPGYLTWEAARAELPNHAVYALTLDDPRLAGLHAVPVRGPGGDILAYKLIFSPSPDDALAKQSSGEGAGG